MKLAGNRLRLGAAALLTTIALAAIITPGSASAGAPGATPSAAHSETGNDGKCYEQVVEYKYQRQTFRTEYKMVKSTRERTGNAAAWSAWTIWGGGSTWHWSVDQNEVNEGHHGGVHNHPTGLDRDFKYFWDGTTTQQVSAGIEKTGWLPAVPAGEGWVQISQRTVKGQQIPCTPQPPNYFEDRTDEGTCEGPGDTSVTVTVYRTDFTYALNSNFEWSRSEGAEYVHATNERALTQKELDDCRPDNPPSDSITEDIGSAECGDTAVETRTSVTNFTFEYNAESKTWDKIPTGTQEVSFGTRPLNAEEISRLTTQCVVDPGESPSVVSGYDCAVDEPSAVLSPDSNANWTATRDLDETALGYRFVVTAKPGYAFSGGKTEIVLEGTIDDSDRDCEVTAEDPMLNATEVCGVIDTYTIPSTFGVAYFAGELEISAGVHDLPQGITVVITAMPTDGHRLTNPNFRVELTGGEAPPCPVPGSSSACTEGEDWVIANTGDGDLVLVFTGYPSLVVLEGDSTVIPEGIDTVEVSYADQTSETFTRPEGCEPDETTTTTTQPPVTTQPPATLDISAIGPVCLSDAPYIDVTFGSQSEFNGLPATVTFIDLDGNVVGTETAAYQAGSTVRLVYPGASVDGAGNPTDWPGWMLVDGQWVVDPSDARLRDGLTVVIEVNPTTTATVSYPAVTETCVAGPRPTGPAPAPAGQLPQTGSPTGVMAMVAAALLLAGGGVLLITRRSTATN